MSLTRRALVFILIGLGVFIGWKTFSRAAQDVVVLRVTGVDDADHYATLWLVRDHPFLWIRAEDRSRRWLRHLRANPNVTLRSGGQTTRYRATFFDNAEAREFVDQLFREKYGLADWVWEQIGNRDSVPIRLVSR